MSSSGGIVPGPSVQDTRVIGYSIIRGPIASDGFIGGFYNGINFLFADIIL